MSVTSKIIKFTAFLSLILGLLFYHPIPPDYNEKNIIRIAFALDNIMKYMGNIAEWSGRNRWQTADRGLFEGVCQLSKEPLEDGIKEKYDEFKGVNVHIFEPIETSQKPRPVLVYIHGGGWTFGSSNTHRIITDVLAKRLQATVVSVNYDLTPERHYPYQLNQVLTVVNYIYNNAERLGVDPTNIGIAGDSAGANLAAATTLKLRDESGPIKLKYQLILFPLIQGLTVDLPSNMANEWHTFHILIRKSISEFIVMYVGEDITASKYVMVGNHTSPEIWKKYGHLVNPKQIPQEYISDDYDFTHFGANRLQERDNQFSQKTLEILEDPYAFPLMAKSLKNLPPTFVMTVQLDPIRDDGLLYLRRLKEDGVAVEHYHDRHGFHGMLTLLKGPLKLQAAVDAIDTMVEYAQRMIAL